MNTIDKKDHLIWIPRNHFFHYSDFSPKHKIFNKQFIKKFGQVKESTQLSKPGTQDEEDLQYPNCNLTTEEEDELIETDEYIQIHKIQGRSHPTHVNNYISKVFLERNSFHSKSLNNSNHSSHQSSPKFNEKSQTSASKFSGLSTKFTNSLSSNINEDQPGQQDYDVQSEHLFNSKKNNSITDYIDEKDFCSQPISNFQNKNERSNQKSQFNQPKHHKCKSVSYSPQKKKEDFNTTHIVASLLKSGLQNAQYLMIYFHSNGEDIISCYDLVNHLRKYLNVNVVTVEYPGYTHYQGNCSAEQIQKDALEVYNYFTEVMKIAPEKIIVIGRSIGTGPATYLASNKKIGCLALVSPFTSLRDLVKDKVGSVFQYLVQDRFNNLENIKKVKCPTFISHGQKDTLIQISHSQAIHKNCSGVCELILPKDMHHNQLDYFKDLSQPLSTFLQKNNINIYDTCSKNPIKFPEYLFQDPKIDISNQEKN